MAKPFHLAGAAIMALLVCSVAGAQRGGAAASHMSARPSSRLSSPAASGFRNAQSAPSARRYGGGFTTQGAPGLGFDYSHLAAISGNFRFNPPGTGSRRGGFVRRERGGFVPIIWGGIPYYYDCLDADNCADTSAAQDAYAQDAYAPVAPQAPAPQVIVIQQPVPAEAPASATPDNDPVASRPAAMVPEPAEPQNTGFVLIRRDGQVLFASACSLTGPNIRYVTPEGVIRTVPLADLDMDSTRSMNEARGLELFSK